MTRGFIRRGFPAILCVFLSACALYRQPPMDGTPGIRQDGLASWYGKKFHGRRTASGEVYNMHGMTAAHRTLPFGTVVRVENLNNGRSVDVVINDRGPFIRGRIIDLSYGAAREVGLIGDGVAPVRVVALDPKASARVVAAAAVEGRSPPFTVQVGAYRDPDNAEAAKERIGNRWGSVSVVPFDAPDGRRLYRVYAGVFADEREAEGAAQRMEQEGMGETFVTRRDY